MTYSLYIEELDLDVELDYDITKENDGIGSYEYWGYRGYDAGHDYYVIENFEYDKNLFTDEQNEFIDKYLIENHDKIEEEILDKFDPSDYL